MVEVAQYVAAPLAGTLLAELGADVIKIEPPGGDAYRQTMPLAPGIGRFFLPLNRGKRSVELDLKTEHGAGARCGPCSRPPTSSPTTRRPRGRRAFGLDWEELHAAVPRLVMGVVSSFGSEGELAGTPAYDLVAQARSGLLTSHAGARRHRPGPCGRDPTGRSHGRLSPVDGRAGRARSRREDGHGRAHRGLAARRGARRPASGSRLAGGRARSCATPWRSARTSSRGPTRSPLGLALNPYYRCYEASDGFIAVACLNLAQREAFAREFGIIDPTIAAPDVVPDDEAVSEVKRRLTAVVAARIADGRSLPSGLAA